MALAQPVTFAERQPRRPEITSPVGTDRPLQPA